MAKVIINMVIKTMTNAIVIVDSSKVNLLCEAFDGSADANLDDVNVDDDDDDATEVPLVMGFVVLLLGFIFGFIGLSRGVKYNFITSSQKQENYETYYLQKYQT